MVFTNTSAIVAGAPLPVNKSARHAANCEIAVAGGEIATLTKQEQMFHVKHSKARPGVQMPGCPGALASWHLGI